MRPTCVLMEYLEWMCKHSAYYVTIYTRPFVAGGQFLYF